MPRKGLGSRLNDKSKLTIANLSEFKELDLDPETLVPSEENFYKIDNINELADNMRMVGHLDPIIVGKVDGEYRIISGHRRREAAVLNKKNGYSEFSTVKCRVKEMSKTMFMLTLLSANAFNRKLSDWELVEQARQLKEYLIKAKNEGLVIEGKMRDYMADTLGISKTKMAQVDKINNNLCDEGKAALKRGDINFTKAHETAGLPVEKQKEVICDKSLKAYEVKEISKDSAVLDSDTVKKQLINHLDTSSYSNFRKEIIGLAERINASIDDGKLKESEKNELLETFQQKINIKWSHEA